MTPGNPSLQYHIQCGAFITRSNFSQILTKDAHSSPVISFVDTAFDWYSASVPVNIYVISYSIGPRYNSTRLHKAPLRQNYVYNALSMLRITVVYSAWWLLMMHFDTSLICHPWWISQNSVMPGGKTHLKMSSTKWQPFCPRGDD